VWQDNSVFFAEKFMDDVKNATETNRHKKTDCFLKTIGFFVSMAERQSAKLRFSKIQQALNALLLNNKL
jgi:hypothetical protein